MGEFVRYFYREWGSFPISFFFLGNLDTGIDFVQSSVAVDGYFIYIVGGRNSSGFSSDFHFTDVRTGIWSKISTKCKKIVTEPNLT